MNLFIKKKKNTLKINHQWLQGNASMKVIETLNNFIPNLIGGSADLSGSNNTKALNSIIINSKSYEGNYIHLALESMVWQQL